MESRELRNWAFVQAAITSLLILGSWILVAGSIAVLGQFTDYLEIPDFLNLLMGVFGVGFMFLNPFFWSYRLVRKTMARMSKN